MYIHLRNFHLVTLFIRRLRCWINLRTVRICIRTRNQFFFLFNGESKTDRQIEIVADGQCTIRNACCEFSGTCFAALAQET